MQEQQKSGWKRINSGAYWDAEQWDPDQRVYVGAEAGLKNHLQAVDPSNDAADIWRVWAGGLTSVVLGCSEAAGPPIDLKMRDPNDKTKLQDLYELLDESVGSGSFGIVRRCKHRGTGLECVIKTVRKDAAGERYRALLVDRCLGEKLLRMSKEAKHPNIAVYLDMLEGAKNFYVIMEELTGAELMDQVEELFPMTEAYLQHVMIEILQALAHLHRVVGLLHRDVKLSNFRFRSKAEDSRLALLDFGFAMSVGEEWDGAVCGTLMFMAPEVVGAKAAAPHLAAMDLWAAGVILYVLLTGDSPANEEEVRRLGRGGSEADEVLRKALAAKELKEASAESLALLQQLLVLDPAKRATAEQALHHQWFSTDGEKHKVNVPTSKYRLTRSASRNSEVLTPKAWSQTGERVARKLELPQSFTPLERIVSEGVDEIKD
ncbi:unc-43 [Symbiodinium natans]|uniref:Unc-43 protein n=1 Tax=Symbiodinium natans TaxID=878477 RepID=A0A812KBR7_9DINO|nr:unc-43 [Symbiodinium natans]